jgi:hypothetical protein
MSVRWPPVPIGRDGSCVVPGWLQRTGRSRYWRPVAGVGTGSVEHAFVYDGYDGTATVPVRYGSRGPSASAGLLGGPRRPGRRGMAGRPSGVGRSPRPAIRSTQGQGGLALGESAHVRPDGGGATPRRLLRRGRRASRRPAGRSPGTPVGPLPGPGVRSPAHRRPVSLSRRRRQRGLARRHHRTRFRR